MKAQGYKIYWITWAWLLVLTLLALGAGSVAMPYAVKATLLITISVGKISLITAFFMHLRTEKLSLILVAVTPIVLGIIMFFLFIPDTMDIARRTIDIM